MGGSWSAERGVKRPHENTEAENETSSSDQSDSSSELHTPKRKRFQSTAQYIVKKLFEEGTDSDVTIQALGKSWHLHKIYLSQCKYFDSMFSGQWLESEQPDIVIEITDENIDAEALRIAFKSLYTDNIFVKPIQVVGVLAAATFLQLEPLIEHCRIVMKGCITCKTVCSFLAASSCYALLDVKDLCMSWLLRCLMVPKNAFMLSEITEELLVSLLDNRDLWIMQVEVDVYCLLKKWVFTQLNPSWSGRSEQLFKEASDFFKQWAENNGCCFLGTEEGRRFIHMFEKVRWMYIINDTSCIQSLKDDQIVPYDWLNPLFKFCWNHHLKVEQGKDIGPREVSEEDFYKWSMRCGRILTHEQEYHWRWLGYTYGLDLLFTLRNKMLTISRNCGLSQRFSGSLSQQETRHVMLRVKVAEVKKKEVCVVASTGVKTISLLTDDAESLLLTLSPLTKFPLQVTMQLLYISPDLSQPFPSLHIPPAPVDIIPSSPPPLPSSPSSADSSRRPPQGTGEREGGSGEGGSEQQVRGTQGSSCESDSQGQAKGTENSCDGDGLSRTSTALGMGSSVSTALQGDISAGRESLAASRWLAIPGTSQTSSSSLLLPSGESRYVNLISSRVRADASSAEAARLVSSSSVTESSWSVSTTVLSSAAGSTLSLTPDGAPVARSSVADAVSLPSCVDFPSSSGYSWPLPSSDSDVQVSGVAITTPSPATPLPQAAAEVQRVRRSARVRSRTRRVV
ncbi:germ cell-less protein-like 1 [Babylonia areolata]|uniref:germ cell-less protein-like 1 n=1 Tax=Babylonia areolata TaxID=304850 RepID=UPI003FD0E520